MKMCDNMGKTDHAETEETVTITAMGQHSDANQRVGNIEKILYFPPSSVIQKLSNFVMLMWLKSY